MNMRTLLFAALGMLVWLNGQSQDVEFAYDPWEVRWQSTVYHPDVARQQGLREASAWQNAAPAAEGWMVEFHEDQALPLRMFGHGVTFNDASPEAKALSAWQWALGSFGWEAGQTGDLHVAKGSKHTRVFAQQTVQGKLVLGTKLQAKFHGANLVMVGSTWFPAANLAEGNEWSQSQVEAFLFAEMASQEGQFGTQFVSDFEIQNWQAAWLPAQAQGSVELHPAWSLEVRGRRGVLPVRYLVWFDALTGEVVLRSNQVMHEAPSRPEAVATKPPVNVFGQVSAQGHENYPYDPSENLMMPHLTIPLQPTAFFTDAEGLFNTSVVGDQGEVSLALQGLFATVYTNGNTPTASVNLVEGYNGLTAPGNLKEVSAYRSVNQIHDHMRTWLPEFSDLDVSLPVNIDVVGECNAFYDGSSVNFYDLGGGCNATSLIADVVYHEYGHAINDKFYQAQFAGFINGAMNEGYADFWAMSLADVAEIGKGFYTDNNDGIRRYDEDPKVYPEDIVGEVHADGEIICGAWYDTHLLLGSDWVQTMTLFVDAYPGLQATVSNGMEGQAYTDVLLDVLQADDDDDDLLNGTPNAQAIIEGFAAHGITLFSYVNIQHEPQEFSPSSTDILIEANASITFPYVVYFENMRLNYRLSPLDDWSSLPMVQEGNTFSALVAGLPAGTVLEYYLDVLDVFGGVSAVNPIASNKPMNANLPHYVLVGVEPALQNDLDDYSEFGYWDYDLPGDNATTGRWTEATPVGSLSDPFDYSTVVAPYLDHTDGEDGFAYVTGLNAAIDDGIGANDVDGGHTTLISPVIDLTPFADPIFSYWRWYVNAPATGANPASDWWQVEISNDAGNTWQYLENTSQQDVSWRRKAFRVADVMDLTNSFQIRFIASDSTTIGEYLDGGSLVEAAVDDIILYDLATDNSVVEGETPAKVGCFPNPTSGRLNATGFMPGSTLRVHDLDGRELMSLRVGGGSQWLDATTWSAGLYLLKGTDEEGRPAEVTFEVIR